MAANASRAKVQYDNSSAVVLQALGTTKTSTFTGTAIPLDVLQTAYWATDNEIADGHFRIALDVTSLKTSASDETYTFTLLANDSVGLNDGTPDTVATLKVVKAGVHEIILDSKTLNLLIANYSNPGMWIGLKVTIAGTAPTITYGAWIEKALDMA